MHNLSCENEFYLHENEKWFPYQRLSTEPRFETEARGNSEMVYCCSFIYYVETRVCGRAVNTSNSGSGDLGFKPRSSRCFLKQGTLFHTLPPFTQVYKWAPATYIEDITWPRGDTKFLFECRKIFHEWAQGTSEIFFQHEKIFYLLYKHQWNTRWAFARKLVIFTCEHITVAMAT